MTLPDPAVRLEQIIAMLREMSLHTDPQEMVRAYGLRVRKLVPRDRNISLSRRDLDRPWFRVTRFSEWKEEINPWNDREKLPLLQGGLLAELLYSNQPRLIDRIELAEGDPAATYLAGQQSLAAIPMFDGGEALNMVISTRVVESGFDPDRFPEIVWMAGLFGRATHNLVLKSQVQEAFRAVDRELKVVSRIQRSLLPASMPEIPGLKLAAWYETSQRAGGDYYDFFPLAGGRWGILIADVSGHGTPATVVMAVTHSIAHLFPGDPGSPGRLLEFLNRHLSRRYTSEVEAFVTAWYGIYDPASRELRCSVAGHPSPRLWRCGDGEARSLDLPANLPLGVLEEVDYGETVIQLAAGDRLVLFTDGITEAMNAQGEEFGIERLDDALEACKISDPASMIERIIHNVRTFTSHAVISDDCTLVVAMVE
jgi:phosphoserine phosphatase RsbU/P